MWQSLWFPFRDMTYQLCKSWGGWLDSAQECASQEECLRQRLERRWCGWRVNKATYWYKSWRTRLIAKLGATNHSNNSLWFMIYTQITIPFLVFINELITQGGPALYIYIYTLYTHHFITWKHCGWLWNPAPVDRCLTSHYFLWVSTILLDGGAGFPNGPSISRISPAIDSHYERPFCYTSDSFTNLLNPIYRMYNPIEITSYMFIVSFIECIIPFITSYNHL